ncbi:MULTISPECIES: DUF1360 domain-containing protein [Vibrio]|uniref:DUF1360 domain-containing protein n=2 Tax=Vibrio TaxID=662 RepID=A0A7X4LI92_9VIBR|nr:MULTISPECIES: DUF1360 domain-containing protein [Vibrio]MBF8999589.1 DUF1360 domain-containing protein [Vibrio nitrifigilis]MZI92157.1 DUF1360 domain-containing protein [Vibrio eleionomae]
MALFTESLHALWVCIVLALASASISITITQTELFVPIRELASKCGHMISYLFRCFYCMSHWVVILGVLIYQPRIITSDYLWIDCIVSIFFAVTLSGYFSGILFKVFLTAMAKKTREQEMAAAKEQ